MALLPVILLVLALISCVIGNTIKINPSTHFFVDSAGRSRFFHGVNAVYKIAPWVPNTDKFDPLNSLSKEDAVNLKKWGFNVVRLGVMWPGLEPGARGEYSMQYLDEIQKIVELLGDQGIFVVLDLHQDLLHRKWCGEGIPDYVYEICHASQPVDTPLFPLPAVNATYPIDTDGNPTLESCLSSMFATYYMSSEVGAGFQCLYDNVDNLWDAMAGFWTTVATRFKSFDNVLGYELINEPWVGNNHETPKELLPHYSEVHYLQPLYEYLHAKIRGIDDEKIIFYEGLTIDYWPSGFTHGPGGPEYNDRQAVAYHIYCPLQEPTPTGEVACDAINDYFFAMRTKDINRLGGGWIMTEFGAAEDKKGDLYALEKSMQQADKHLQSWMYWQFKYYQDITTCTPTGESLYNEDGTVVDHKLRILSRTYPQAVAGSIESYHFDPLLASFTMKYSLLSELDNSNSDSMVTQVYLNRELYYPKGAHVTVTNDDNGTVDSLSVSCSHLSNIITFSQQSPVPTDSSKVTVHITPCIPLVAECNCR